MISKKMEINIPIGMEARPVALLVQVASKYDSKIYLEYENKRINAKSIMGMMSLALPTRTEITILADGADEEEAMRDMEACLGGK